MLPQFPLKQSWLWFLLALFIDSIVNYPLLKWLQRRKDKKEITLKDDGQIIAGQVIILIVFFAIFMFVMKVDGGKAQDVFTVLLLILAYTLFYTLPIVVINKGYTYSNMLKLIGPILCILLSISRNGYNDGPLYGFIYMINFDLVFMMQGIVDQIFINE